LCVRVNTDASGTVVGEQGHYPFGEFWYSSSATTKWRFTSYERDSESGNDYAIFRYHSNRLGRFLTPDPIAGSVFNPQSLNRYAYVTNDPVNLIDPFGLQVEPGDWAEIEAPLPLPPVVETVRVDAYIDVTAGIGGYYLAELANAGGPHLLATLDPLDEDPLKGRPVRTLVKAAKDLQKQKLSRKDCKKLLNALGVTAEQVRQAALQANFINGVGSTVPLSSLYANSPVPSVRRAGAAVTGTVGEALAEPGVVAWAQMGGSNVYVDPSKINPANYWQNMATVFHEVLHNITGMTDPDIQRALGLPENGSSNITNRIVKDCF
jgi:RHS repeat-associated protein